MYARMKKIAFIAVLSLAMTACAASLNSNTPVGKLVSEVRPVSGFNRVSLSGSGTLVVTQGSSEGLTVEADEAVLEIIETRVVGNELKIGLKPGVSGFGTGPIYYYLTVDDLNAINLSGSGDVEMESLETDFLEMLISGSGDVNLRNLKAEDLDLSLSGAGNFKLDGEVNKQTVDISGSGKYRASDLRSQTAMVRISGAGSVQVWVEEVLDVSISGSGKLEYYGTPVVNERISGAGRLISRGEK
jgi:hypothetical protein